MFQGGPHGTVRAVGRMALPSLMVCVLIPMVAQYENLWLCGTSLYSEQNLPHNFPSVPRALL